MKLNVTMVLPDGENRWYIEGLVEDAEEPCDHEWVATSTSYQARRCPKCNAVRASVQEATTKRSLHVNLAPGQRVPEIGDQLLFYDPREEEE